MAQMLKHATESPPPLGPLVGHLPAGFQAVMDRFLTKTPATRYQTPAEAADALRPFATGGAPAVAAKMVPAYRDWLESESAMEMPKDLPAASGATVKAPAVAAPPIHPPAQQTTRPAPAAAAPPRPAPPKTGPLPTQRTGPAPSAPRPVPVPVPLPATEEVDVELVTPSVGPSAAAFEFDRPAGRPLWSLDRRDWIMLAAGATGILSAVGLGYGLAKALKKKPDADE
jgi:hypothetical protein